MKGKSKINIFGDIQWIIFFSILQYFCYFRLYCLQYILQVSISFLYYSITEVIISINCWIQ